MTRSLARSNVYNLLSLCFSYPDDEIYACIAAGEQFREARKSLCLLADDHFDACLRIFAEVSCGGKRAMQREMAQEYRRLFIPAVPPMIPLHGATCPGKDELVSGGKTFETLRFFREAGFTPHRGDMPGHIAHQLEFMGNMAEQERTASCGERIRLEEMQLKFLSRFLITGVAAYCEKVMPENSLPFYCILGDFTQEFISFEINYLGIPEEKEQ